jgi:dienelactone hydrolase
VDFEPRFYEPLTAEEKKDAALAYRRRNGQVMHRAAEVSAAVDLAAALANPDDATGSSGLSLLLGEGSAPGGANARNLQALREALRGKLDMTAVSVVGHSFGAGTAYAAAANDDRIHAVCALDPWLYPLPRRMLQRGLCHVPVLTICGEGFAKWKENAIALRLLLTDSARESHRTATGEATTEAEGAALADVTRDANAGGSSPAGGDLFGRANSSGLRRRGGQGSGEGADEQGSEGTEEDPFQRVSNGVDKQGQVCTRLRLDAGRVHPSSILLRLRTAEHHNFSDFAVTLRNFARVARKVGRADPVECIAALREVTLDFLSSCRGAQHHTQPPRSGRSGTTKGKGGAKSAERTFFTIPAQFSHVVHLEPEDVTYET